MAALTHSECVDFLQFQDTLKKMRLLDDTITYALNVSLPTESFTAQKDCHSTCKEIFGRLERNYSERERAFNKCLEYSKAKVTELKATKAKDGNNITVLKELRSEQHKVRTLEVEQGVEEVIRARTKKVFYERCRPYFTPENVNV